MREEGTLTKWNDDRGVGFIALPESYEEIFVHISAFQPSGTRPCIGEMISFEIRTGPDGRKWAEDVRRPYAPAQDRERRNAGTGHMRAVLGTVLGFAVTGILAVNDFLSLTSSFNEPDARPSTESDIPTLTSGPNEPDARPSTDILTLTSSPNESDATPSTEIEPVTLGQLFRCDGRTQCSQMTSCLEAIYFSHRCPNTQLDPDNDGTPCEQQWCK